jgi:hypothetical protein
MAKKSRREALAGQDIMSGLERASIFITRDDNGISSIA